MTIASEANRSGPYACNGVTTHFPYEFRIYDAAHIRVILTKPDGTETTLATGTDYTVSGVGESGGGVIDMVAAYATGHRVTLILNVPFTQEIDLENQGAYFAETIERAIDLQTQMSLQLKEQVARSVVLPVTSSVSVDKLTGAVLSLAEIQPQITALAPIAQDITTVAGIADAVVAVEGRANAAAAAAALATGKAAEAAASAEAAALFDPAVYYLKTAFKSDASGDAPVKYGANGELLGRKIIINAPSADQSRMEFWADGVDRWIVYRNGDDTFNIWSRTQGTSVIIDPSNNRVNFTALPKVYGNRDVVILDTDGKLPALDGSKLMSLSTLGVGQTWQAISRTSGTVYQNTTPKPISVAVQAYHNGGGGSALIGATNPPTVTALYFAALATTTGTQFYQSGTVIVPPGHYYETTGAATIIAELRT